VLGQRLAEWCGHGPVLEEDIAAANVALDLIGQARLLLAHAGKLEGKGRDEDQLAFLREVPDFRNATLLELPNGGVASAGAAGGDYAVAIVRNLLFGAYQVELWEALSKSTDGELAAIAAKSLKEARYHLRHAADWAIRLGDGTDESHARTQAALDALWPYTHELLETDPVEAAVARHGIGVESASLRQGWHDIVAAVLAEATLALPPDTAFRSTGKLGRHSEHLGFLLAEMQSLHRQHPGATW
ncbi:MAG: 1,2-phenylacetyl-CoA epoxidase subunit PaaC, partial [Burkholderiales bacterium]